MIADMTAYSRMVAVITTTDYGDHSAIGARVSGKVVAPAQNWKAGNNHHEQSPQSNQRSGPATARERAQRSWREIASGNLGAGGSTRANSSAAGLSERAAIANRSTASGAAMRAAG